MNVQTNTTLYPNFDIFPSKDGTKIYIVEVTGLYDATTNVGGYGGVNPDAADVLPVITVTDAAGVEYIFEADVSSDPDLTGIFADDSSTNILTLDASVLGGVSGEKITDQLFTFEFDWSDALNDPAEWSSVTTLYYGSAAQLRCCAQKFLAQISSGNCGCDSPDQANATYCQLIATIDSFVWAAECNDITSANELLLQAQKICRDKNCGC